MTGTHSPRPPPPAGHLDESRHLSCGCAAVHLPNEFGDGPLRVHPRHAAGGWLSEPGLSPSALPFLVTPHPSEPSPRRQPRRVTAALALSPSTRGPGATASVTAGHRPTHRRSRPQGLAPSTSSLSRAVLPRRETRCSLGLASISWASPGVASADRSPRSPAEAGANSRSSGLPANRWRAMNALSAWSTVRSRWRRGTGDFGVRPVSWPEPAPPRARRLAATPGHLDSGDRRPLAAPREDWPRSGSGPGGTPFPPGVLSAAPRSSIPLPPRPRRRRSDRAGTGSRRAEAHRKVNARGRGRVLSGPKMDSTSTRARLRRGARRESGSTAEAGEPAPRPMAPRRPAWPEGPTGWERSEELGWPPGRGCCSTPQGGERCRDRDALPSKGPPV
jgi:hypothetical protein